MTKQRKTVKKKAPSSSKRRSQITRKTDLDDAIATQLKNTPEQKMVVGPLVQFLISQGWKIDQLVFGKKEWLVPKSPSEQTKREKNRNITGSLLILLSLTALKLTVIQGIYFSLSNANNPMSGQVFHSLRDIL